MPFTPGAVLVPIAILWCSARAVRFGDAPPPIATLAGPWAWLSRPSAVLNEVATEPEPTAVPAAPAELNEPNAVLVAILASAPVPTAVLAAPVAWAPAPTAVVLVAVACAESPTAVAAPPDASDWQFALESPLEA
jgi:hypothetical protein